MKQPSELAITAARTKSLEEKARLYREAYHQIRQLLEKEIVTVDRHMLDALRHLEKEVGQQLWSVKHPMNYKVANEQI